MDLLAETCKIDANVYNGEKVINAQDEFFMTDINIFKILKNLKIKNCEEFDRIPLRILNEGAEKLVTPLGKLYFDPNYLGVTN